MNSEPQPRYQYTLGMLAAFFLLAFAITWAILIPTLSSVPDDRQTPFIVLAAFGPFTAALVIIWTFQGRKALSRWLRQIFRLRVPVLPYLTGAFLLPLAIGGLHFGFYWLLVNQTPK